MFERIVDAHHEAELLLVVGDREPVLDQDDARAHQHALEFGHGMEEFLELRVGAEAHHPLDAGAVVPAAVEQDDFAAGRQMRDIALEIPLRALALVRRRQRRDPADARIETLGDPLDDPAFAGGVAPLEDHDDLELLVQDPVLQLDQLALQAKKLLEIDASIERFHLRMLGDILQQLGQPIVVDFELELLVEAVEHFAIDALMACVVGHGGFHAPST